MVLPVLSMEERTRALEKAAAARQRRAAVKSQLKHRQITLEVVLNEAHQDDALAKMRVHELLESLPRVGTTTAGRLMEEIGIAQSRRLRGLGKVQRHELLKRFG